MIQNKYQRNKKLTANQRVHIINPRWGKRANELSRRPRKRYRLKDLAPFPFSSGSKGANEMITRNTAQSKNNIFNGFNL